MQMKLRNIGMLEKAELNLNSLTLIAGENDNGKSTIGKVIFCIIKAINKYKDELQESKEQKLKERLENLFFFTRNILTHNPVLKNTEDIYFLILDYLENFILELKKRFIDIDNFRNIGQYVDWNKLIEEDINKNL